MNKLLVAILSVMMVACSQRHYQETPEAILAQMRADTCWIQELDSLAQIAIGPGAKCIDPVWHTFSYNGRTWFFNQDWGGVLEIPSDYIPEDDYVQAELSFHGTSAWSPDSLITISFYAGIQIYTLEDNLESLLSGLTGKGYTIQDTDESENAFIVRARSGNGVNYYGRYICPIEIEKVEYLLSIVYPDNSLEEAEKLIEMARPYPAGPDGQIFRGEAL